MKNKDNIQEDNFDGFVVYDTWVDYVARDLTCPCCKDVYRTFSDAQKSLTQRSDKDDKKRIYHCDMCGNFHLSTKMNHVGIKRNKYKRKSYRSQNSALSVNSITEEMLKHSKKSHPYNKAWGATTMLLSQENSWDILEA